MSTIIYPSPIFGPVHSRRLGISLGINLLPADGKVCSFDCIYCECGFNEDHRPSLPLPTRESVAQHLEEKLQQMTAEGQLPDVLTFAGNGEPTCHPHFAEIIDDTYPRPADGFRRPGRGCFEEKDEGGRDRGGHPATARAGWRQLYGAVQHPRGTEVLPAGLHDERHGGNSDETR